jgi:uncharacterized protein (TIGR02266 family)
MQDIAARFREYIKLERRRDREGLSREEFERWGALKRHLTRHFDPELSEEQSSERQSVRVPTRLAVTFRDQQELRSSLMTNLSRGGVFIRTEHPAAMGTKLVLKIEIASTGELLEVPAQVVTLNISRDFRQPQRGMGLRFLPESEEMERKLDELYEHQLKQAAVSDK